MNKPQSRVKNPLKIQFSLEEEKEEFKKLSLLKSSKYFVIEACWLDEWILFMKGGPCPGNMKTQNLLENGNLKPGLRYPKDYKILNIQQWIFFYAKYGSEPPLEITQPFSSNLVQGGPSAPHYLSTPCTERMSLETLVSYEDKDFKQGCSGVVPENPYPITKRVGFVGINIEIKFEIFLVNSVINLKAFQDLLSASCSGKLSAVLNRIIMKMGEKLCVVQSRQLENILFNILNKQKIAFEDVLAILDEESCSEDFSRLGKLFVRYQKFCDNCGILETGVEELRFLEFDTYKSVKNALECYESSIYLSEECEKCQKYLKFCRKIEDSSEIVVLKIRRDRDIPYQFRVWNKIRYKKSIELGGKKYSLNSVICNGYDSNSEQLKMICKKYKNWYSYSSNGKISTEKLNDVLNQVVFLMIYSKT